MWYLRFNPPFTCELLIHNFLYGTVKSKGNDDRVPLPTSRRSTIWPMVEIHPKLNAAQNEVKRKTNLKRIKSYIVLDSGVVQMSL